MQEAMQERVREMFATAPDRVGSKNMSCLLRESLHGNAEAISDCGIPGELFPSAINLLAETNDYGRSVSPAFVEKYCEKSMKVHVSFTCTYGGVTMAFS
jgi:hypothetical protein